MSIDTNDSVKLVDCTEKEHAAAILALFNDTIANSSALYDYEPRSLSFMEGWFAAKRARNYPVIGAVNGQGELLAFASWGAFRDYPANKYTVEHSVYVRNDCRRQGLARKLMQELITRAQKADMHVLMGVIDAANSGSIALHEQLGFKHVGTLPQIGFKFGHWLDAALYQLILETPAQPVDG
ncbi:Phosphinothricin N-acetyltransferase [Snodgrassella communis]|jgi:L-amino acid N-acyltransferase|uniref:GNAT family N-acetyltransferase n=1 Tax=Snodgrassella communis TaxID=2946699 RepID=UPI0004618D0E|nr:GNAT family N-acetyltransferase [Snodgrassella communis]KDN13541.1 Phosphinothricin N-acetyltransferase [Snodgrassella communis]